MVQRSIDPATGRASTDGAQALSSLAELYDVAGGLRRQLVDLIAAVRLRDGDEREPAGTN